MSLTRETICLLANYALPSLFELDAASGNHQKMCESGDWRSHAARSHPSHCLAPRRPHSCGSSHELKRGHSNFWLARGANSQPIAWWLGRHVCKQQSPKQRRQQSVSQPRSATSSFPDFIACWGGADEWQRPCQRKLPAALASGTSARPELPLQPDSRAKWDFKEQSREGQRYYEDCGGSCGELRALRGGRQ
jgi:hypothetical protein